MDLVDETMVTIAGKEAEYFKYKSDANAFETPAKCIAAAFRDIQKRTNIKRCRFPEPRLRVELTWNWCECAARMFSCDGQKCDECPHYRDAARNFRYIAGAVEGYSGDAMVVPLAFIGGIIQDLPRHAHNVLLMEAGLSIWDMDTGNTVVRCEALIDGGRGTTVEVDSSEIKPVKRILKQLGLIGRPKRKGGD